MTAQNTISCKHSHQLPQPLRIVVVGGGAAGFFTAINTAELCRQHHIQYDITILEASPKCLQKVLISGGGRCNVTHHCFEPKQLVSYYPRGQKELLGLFAKFQPQDMVSWMKNHGIRLVAEADGRMFPSENTSEAIIDCFLETAHQLNIQIKNNQRITHIEKTEDGFITLTQQQTYESDRLVLATGYSPPGWKLAESLGHTIIPPVPSLFPFKTATNPFHQIPGISLEHTKGSLTIHHPDSKKPTRFDAEGPLLFTHTGLSGPVIYRLSALGAAALAQNKYQGKITIDLLPQMPEDELRLFLNQSVKEAQSKKLIKNTDLKGFPQRLWLTLLEFVEADFESPAQTLTSKTINKLVENIKRMPSQVIGKSPSKEEFVSCGGIDLKEVDFKTMESKRCPGLYLAGEILNIDGLTGGFNFQSCWSGGWAAANGITQNPN